MNIKDEYRCMIPADKQIEIAKRYNPNQQQSTTSKNNNPSKREIKNAPSTQKGRFSGRIKALIAAGLLTVAGFIGNTLYNNYREELTAIYSNDLQSDIEDETLQKAKEHLTLDDLVFDGQSFNVSLKSNRTNEYNVLFNTDIDELLNEYFANTTDEAKSNLENRKKDIANLNFHLIKASLADSLGCDIDEISIKFTDTTLRIVTPKDFLEYWSDNGKYNDKQISTEHARIIRSIAKAYQESKSEQPNLSIDKLLEQHANLKHILGEYNYTIDNDALCLQGIDDSKLYKYSTGILGNSFTEIKEDEGPELE